MSVDFLDVDKSRLIEYNYIQRAPLDWDCVVNFVEVDDTQKRCRVTLKCYSKKGVWVWVRKHSGTQLGRDFKIYGKKKLKKRSDSTT